MRVKDTLGMLAARASRDRILADYRYLEDDDIPTTLAYAALRVDHRVLRVA